ncbi:VWA domain-containing protein [Pseudoclavibacter sp. JSM 162008]|uniref:VWA domain-containing protein n=1 Tax=Pseudoclavibacter sp. JSM 162008 TaxID=3229855 RepID=UPI003524484F
MTWNPILPPVLLALVGMVLLGFCVFALVRASDRRRRDNWVLRLAACALIVVAAFRPGVGSAPAPNLQSEVDVLFVVDTTASMVAEDWDGAPRLDGVKADISALTAAHEGARFGLVTFDAAAVQRLPFTADTTALDALLQTLRPEVTQYSRGSSISIAEPLVRDVLEAAAEAEPERARLVYYLGDGEQTAETEPESFSAVAGYLAGGAVLGYGTEEGGPMKATAGTLATDEPSYILDGQGQQARSVIDTAALQTIADDLALPLEVREPGTEVVPAEVDGTRVTKTGGSAETAFEVYWILAAAAFLLLLRDVWESVKHSIELSRARGGTA